MMKVQLALLCIFFCAPLSASAAKKINAESPALVTIKDLRMEYSVTLPNGYLFKVSDGKQVSPASSPEPFNYKGPDENSRRAQTVLSLAQMAAVRRKDKTEWKVFSDNSVE